MKRKLELTKREIAAIKRAVEYDCEALPEDDSPDGHFSFDEDVAWVYEQIENGNEWGWCTVRVIASIPHWELADILNIDADNVLTAAGIEPDFNSFYEFVGDDYLGGCAYHSKLDFMRSGGYYPQMKREALNDLIRQVADVKHKALTAVVPG